MLIIKSRLWKSRAYKYTDGNWDLYHVYNNESSDMETEHGYVALTSDASKVAIGTNNENSGFFEAFPNRNKQPKFDLSTNTEDFVVKRKYY